jgi:hypothetical protein
MPFTLRNLREDLVDVGSNFDGAPDLEFRLASKALELEQSGLSYQRIPPTTRSVADVASPLPQFAQTGSGPDPVRGVLLCIESSGLWRDTAWTMSEERTGRLPLKRRRSK